MTTTAGYDGTIKIDTSVDASNLEKDANGIGDSFRSLVSSVSSTISGVSANVANTFSGIKARIDAMTQSFSFGSSGVGSFLGRLYELWQIFMRINLVLSLIAGGVALLVAKFGSLGAVFAFIRGKGAELFTNLSTGASSTFAQVGEALKVIAPKNFGDAVKAGNLLVDSFVKVKGAVKSAAQETKTFSSTASGLSDVFNKVKMAVGGLLASLGIIVSLQQIIQFAKASISASSEMQSATIGLRSVVEGMGGSFEKAKGFLKDYVADGLIPATNAMTAYKNLTARGYNTAQIEATLNALKNSAAFSRQGSLTMGQAVQGATEGLKNENSILVDNAGVTKNVSIMWKEYAASIGSTVNNLTKQQKIEAEVQGIMQETRFQMGDAAKLSNTYSGRVAALGTSFYNLQVAVGNSLTPIISAIIPVIKQVVDWLVILFNQFTQVVQLFFGADAVSNNLSENLGDAAGAAGDLAKNTEAAGEAAKGALAPFDQLNVLQESTPAGGNGAGAGAGAGALTPPTADEGAMDKALGQMEEWKTNLLKMLEPASAAFARLQKALQPLGKTLFAGLKWGWDNIIVPLAKWSIKSLLPVFLDLLTAGVKLFNTVLIALKPLGQWLWDNFLKPIADFTGGLIVAWLKDVTSGFDTMRKWLEQHPNLMKDIIKGFNDLLAPLSGIGPAIENVKKWLGELGANFLELWKKASDSAKENYDKLVLQWSLLKVWFDLNVTKPISDYFANMWTSISANATNAWTNVKNAWTGAQNWFNVNFIGGIQTAFSTFWTNIATWGGQAWTNIQTFWNNAVAWFTTMTNNIKTLFSNAWNSVLSSAQSIWSTISTLFKLGWDWVNTNITQPLKTAFENALAGVNTIFHNVFDGIVNYIKGIMNGVIGLLNNMLRNSTSGINTLIGAVNALGAWIPGWTNFPTLSTPSIPYLATGAVIPPNAKFAAILGDQTNGRNIETPESLMRQVVREEAGGNNEPMTITLVAREGDTLMRMFVQMISAELDGEKKRRGGSFVVGGEPQ